MTYIQVTCSSYIVNVQFESLKMISKWFKIRWYSSWRTCWKNMIILQHRLQLTPYSFNKQSCIIVSSCNVEKKHCEEVTFSKFQKLFVCIQNIMKNFTYALTHLCIQNSVTNQKVQFFPVKLGCFKRILESKNSRQQELNITLCQ